MSSRQLQWPGFVEQLLIGLAVSAVVGVIGLFWTRFPSWSIRIPAIAGAVALLIVLSALFALRRSPDISVVLTAPTYEDKLTELAKSHRGTIRWVTKTSVWADQPNANRDRLDVKIKGIRTRRIGRAEYIVHLGYWRRLVEAGGSALAGTYDLKILTLLDHVRNYEECPPDKVVILVGELTDPGPPHWFGLYRGRGRTTLVLGYELLPHGPEIRPRLFVRHEPELIKYYESEFLKQWNRYIGEASSRISARRRAELDGRVDQPSGRNDYDVVALRKDLELMLEAERDWISARAGGSKSIALPAIAES